MDDDYSEDFEGEARGLGDSKSQAELLKGREGSKKRQVIQSQAQ